MAAKRTKTLEEMQGLPPEWACTALCLIAGLVVGFAVGVMYVRGKAIEYGAAQYEFNRETGDSDFVWYGKIRKWEDGKWTR